MKRILVLLAMIACVDAGVAQSQLTLKLYPNGEPNSNGLDYAKYAKDKDGVEAIEPSLSVFLPKGDAPTQAVLICPGGGYRYTSFEYEGTMVAKWLNEQGIAGIVLRYRMPNLNYEVPLTDAQTALRIIRDSAKRCNINPAKVGVMGFSAGGHLASTLSTHFRNSAQRPDFSVLVYPVITMREEFTHPGSRSRLIGAEYNEKLVERFSNEGRVSKSTPPTFLVHSDDDKTVPSRNSIEYYLALKSNGVPAELHIYPSGGHGWSFRDKFKYQDSYLRELSRWLAERR